MPYRAELAFFRKLLEKYKLQCLCFGRDAVPEIDLGLRRMLGLNNPPNALLDEGRENVIYYVCDGFECCYNGFLLPGGEQAFRHGGPGGFLGQGRGHHGARRNMGSGGSPLVQGQQPAAAGGCGGRQAHLHPGLLHGAECLKEGLFPAGRLDKDTEGFVLLTDDGELSHKMLSPKSHVPKTYFVRLAKPWEESYKEQFALGLTIDGNEKCLPAEFDGSHENDHECTLVLHEGKFHQVKRMFKKLGNEVVYLRRVAIGNVNLREELALGECLEMLHKDVENLLAK